jgi:hypothetical protein
MLHQKVSIQGYAVNLKKLKYLCVGSNNFKIVHTNVRKEYSASALIDSFLWILEYLTDEMVTNYTSHAFHCYSIILKSD